MPEDLKQCTGCGETKPVSEYFIEKRRNKPRSRCKTCYSAQMKRHYAENKGYYADFAKRWRANNPERANASSNRSRVKRRLDVHTAWWGYQGGKCAVCRNEIHEPLAGELDHCHRTGVARGLLCHRCNMILGLCDDDRAVLQSAIEYLTTHGADPTSPKLHRKSAWWRSYPPGHEKAG